MSNDPYLPNWATDIADVRRFVIEAHGDAVNIPTQGATGSTVHIGIIDSASEVPAETAGETTLRQGPGHSFIDSTKPDTTNHGTEVFVIASAYCPAATYSLYQAVRADRKIPIEAFADGITAAIDDGVDILNISAGEPWGGPIDANPYVSELKRAIAAGIIVVGAAGNWKVTQENRPPVHCPGALQDVIAVGGFVTDCPAKMGEEPADSPVGPYYIAHDPQSTYGDRIPEGPFCGRNGCTDGKGCISNNRERPWEYNPSPIGEKPEVLAPVHIPTVNADGNPILDIGTSFAAPIVTGSLGTILDELRRSEGSELTPYRARESVMDGATEIYEGTLRKYDAMGTREALGLL